MHLSSRQNIQQLIYLVQLEPPDCPWRYGVKRDRGIRDHNLTFENCNLIEHPPQVLKLRRGGTPNVVGSDANELNWTFLGLAAYRKLVSCFLKIRFTK
jgi:hypothetical protein